MINRAGATIVVDAPGLALGPEVTVTNDRADHDVDDGHDLGSSTHVPADRTQLIDDLDVPPTPPPLTPGPSSSAAAQSTTPSGVLPPTGPGGARVPILVALVCALVGATAVITAGRAENPDR